MPREQERFFKNAQTWKQISTNVPPEMLKALKKQLSDEYTMSHLLRDLIAESDVMKDGLPQPIWSKELAKSVAAMREEISGLKNELTALRETRGVEPTSLVEQQTNRLQFAPDYDDDFANMDRQENPVEQEQNPEAKPLYPRFYATQPDEESENQPVKEKAAYWPIINRLTEMLGVARKTA